MANEPRDPGVNLEETSPGATVPGVETNDAAQVSYPGVYLEETGVGAKEIPGVPTSGGGGRRGIFVPVKAYLLRRWRRPPAP